LPRIIAYQYAQLTNKSSSYDS